jgi:hypothetical protein
MAAGTMVLGSAPAHAAGWQAWGAWKSFGNGTFQCRNYVDATTVGSRLLISGSVNCTKQTSIAMYVTTTPQGGTHSKWCQQTTQTCYISYYVNNPSGTQSWSVLTTSNIGGEAIPRALITFRI